MVLVPFGGGCFEWHLLIAIHHACCPTTVRIARVQGRSMRQRTTDLKSKAPASGVPDPCRLAGGAPRLLLSRERGVVPLFRGQASTLHTFTPLLTAHHHLHFTTGRGGSSAPRSWGQHGLLKSPPLPIAQPSKLPLPLPRPTHRRSTARGPRTQAERRREAEHEYCVSPPYGPSSSH